MPPIIAIPPRLDGAQRALLEEGLIQAYLSVESQEISRQSHWMMKRLAQGLPVPEQILVDSHAHLPEALPRSRTAS